MTWEVSEKTLQVLAESEIWKKFSTDFIKNITFVKRRIETPYDVAQEIFVRRLKYLGRKWLKEEDVFNELFMNMGGGLPYDVLIEARRCMKIPTSIDELDEKQSSMDKNRFVWDDEDLAGLQIVKKSNTEHLDKN